MGYRADRLKEKGKETLYMVIGLFILGMADHFLGIYAWLMGGLAFFQKIGFMDVTANQYATIALVALACLVLIKSGVFAKKEDSNRRRKQFKQAEAKRMKKEAELKKRGIKYV